MIQRFRWVECQLDTLKKCYNLFAIRKSLGELPSTLDKTYDRILNSIPEMHRREAHCVMQVLAVTYRPLKIDEVAEAVAVDCENEIFNPEYRLQDPEDILEICSSLVCLSGYIPL